MTYYEVWFSNVVLYRAASLERCRHFVEKISKMNPEGVFSVDFNSLSFENGDGVEVMRVKKVHL